MIAYFSFSLALNSCVPFHNLFPNFRTYSSKRYNNDVFLEGHIQLLKESNQPISLPMSLLLAVARKREEKCTAKRVANRRSTCTSRA